MSEIRVFTRQLSNFAFPPEIKRPAISLKIAETLDETIAIMNVVENEEHKDEVKREKIIKYKKEI